MVCAEGVTATLNRLADGKEVELHPNNPSPCPAHSKYPLITHIDLELKMYGTERKYRFAREHHFLLIASKAATRCGHTNEGTIVVTGYTVYYS